MHNFWLGIYNNHPLWIATLAVALAQVLKVAWVLIRERRLILRLLTDAGGMPSSHSSMVSALAFSVGKHAGWDTPVFAVACIFAAVVMYDAAGIRRAAGEQAEVLNRLIDDLYKGKLGSFKRMKEILGHTPKEVVAGGILGTLIGLIF
ncbi:MAG TPA: divergent PAP2 family protein [Bacillota bacterium]|nr:divergent PAP2 family protein [Bacillota bacterium]